MSTTQAKGAFTELKGKLKKAFAELTDDDLLYEEGQQEEMWGKIQKKIGKTKDEVKKLIDKV